MRWKRIHLVFMVAWCICVPWSCAHALTEHWPEVVPFHSTYHFPDARRSGFDLLIYGVKSDPLYGLECHTFEYEKDPSFDYSGDFECRLKSLYSKEAYSNLLTENPGQTRDWQSRGRFLAEELRGDCADYPEFGRIRQFRLRGMKLTLTISEFEFREGGEKDIRRKDGPILKSFRFDIQVDVDVSATSEIAAPVNYAYPSRQHPYAEDMSLQCSLPGNRPLIEHSTPSRGGRP